MKTILEISSTQLRRFFFSPIAWLVLLTILILLGYQFTSMLEAKESFFRRFGYVPQLTREIYMSGGGPGGRGGVFPSLLNSLYLFLPLLSMGLVSADLANGSIKLMFSSPIKIWHFVIGKYLASVVFSTLIVLCTALVILPGFFIVQDFELQLLISGCLGVFLLSCTYMAIGLFISSLSSNQIVVAIATFVILGFLGYADKLWQGIPILGEFMFWLGMPARAQPFVDGLFSTQNFFYFILVITLFVGLTYLRFTFSRNKHSAVLKWSVSVVFLTSLLAIGVTTSNPYLIGYYDMTSNKRNTLSEPSLEIVKQLENVPLQMNVYANILDHNVSSALPGRRNNDQRIFQEFIRFLPQLEFNYHYFYAPVSDNKPIFLENPDLDIHGLGEKLADAYGLDFNEVLKPNEIEQLVDLGEEDNQYIREVKANGNSCFLRMYDGILHFPSQRHTAAALRNLLIAPHKVSVLAGKGERSITQNKESDYKDAFMAKVNGGQKALINLGFTNIREVSTDSISFQEDDILKSDILVIADPQQEYPNLVNRTIVEYIKQGGDLLLALEPDNESLKSVLNALGVEQLPGTLLNTKETDFEKDLMLAVFDSLHPNLPNNFIKDWVWRYRYPVTMPKASGLRALNSSSFEINPFIVVDSVKTSADSLDLNLPLKTPVAFTLQRTIKGKTQKVFISGDADFISNKELDRGNISNYNDKSLLPYIFYWLTDGAFPVDVTVETSSDRMLYLAQEPGQTVFYMQLVLLGLVPITLLGAGASLLIQRNRR